MEIVPGPPVPTEFHVTVRFYAAARAAAGHEEELIPLDGAANLAELLTTLRGRPHAAESDTPPLAEVLRRCSFLRNEIAIRDPAESLHAGDVIDVLPPFAGG